MSVAEIKTALRKMSGAERQEIARALIKLSNAAVPPPRRAENFAEAKNYVFENYDDLLRRLAE